MGGEADQASFPSRSEQVDRKRDFDANHKPMSVAL